MVNKYGENEIPLEGVWLDKPYMSDYHDFTYDRVNWDGLK